MKKCPLSSDTPTNPNTTIRYSIPIESYVSLKIYTPLGQLIQAMYDGIQFAGEKSIEWNATGIPSGIYFYRFESTSTTDPKNHFAKIMKMLLIK